MKEGDRVRVIDKDDSHHGEEADVIMMRDSIVPRAMWEMAEVTLESGKTKWYSTKQLKPVKIEK